MNDQELAITHNLEPAQKSVTHAGRITVTRRSPSAVRRLAPTGSRPSSCAARRRAPPSGEMSSAFRVRDARWRCPALRAILRA